MMAAESAGFFYRLLVALRCRGFLVKAQERPKSNVFCAETRDNTLHYLPCKKGIGSTQKSSLVSSFDCLHWQTNFCGWEDWVNKKKSLKMRNHFLEARLPFLKGKYCNDPSYQSFFMKSVFMNLKNAIDIKNGRFSSFHVLFEQAAVFPIKRANRIKENQVKKELTCGVHVGVLNCKNKYYYHSFCFSSSEI